MPRYDDPTGIEPRPTPPPAPGATATTQQLRGDIVSGATGDKVAMMDPAASPLGTDDEATGAPPNPEMVAAVRRHERTTAPDPGPRERTGTGRGATGPWLLGVLLLLVAFGLVAAWIGFAG